ncbi:hypothetical protein SDC9_144304 [bioreactor metagenome]|uniref:Uncharacterized protein n=1 Tax=bioreactor metagenome TaxID=1076179 RepID=A0A645E6E6_9ZZZZ
MRFLFGCQQTVPVPVGFRGDGPQPPQGNTGNTQQLGGAELNMNAVVVVVPDEIAAAVLRGIDCIGLLIGVRPARFRI